MTNDKLLRECHDRLGELIDTPMPHFQLTGTLRAIRDAMFARLSQPEPAAPQPSTADFLAAPSQEGVGQGEVAGAAPGLPEEPKQWALIRQALPKEFIDYADALRTFALLAVKERDEAWAAVSDAFCGVGSHYAAAWEKKHAATIAAARRGR